MTSQSAADLIEKKSKTITFESSHNSFMSESELEKADNVHDLSAVNLTVGRPNEYIDNYNQ